MKNALVSLRFILFLIAIVASLVAGGCDGGQVNYPSRQMPDGFNSNETELNAGRDLFRDKCASCHGKPSEGRSGRASFFEPAAPDFTDAYYRDTDPAYLYWRIEAGKTVEPYLSQGSVMPAWGAHLSEEKIWQIVAYLQFRAH
jgi:mono/diheme cytochrome c family protein